jgi:hypothetical protein
MRDDMTRFLMIAGAVAILALPAATPALACGAHTASAQASSVDLAAAAKKALPPPAVTNDKARDTQGTPAK